ncbi:MAG: hypothetical protein HRT69_06270 [Flavobacteriaceae bacterium]|nr:hypothetical protein [Flavobacteriaceae bacterium]
MNLSKEELQFIDTYLKNSDVIYTDIRLELTDHVASAIEVELAENSDEIFYKVFKSYMVQNKKSLLKNIEVEQVKLRDKIIKRFGKGFLAKEVLFLLVLALLTPSLLELNFSEDILMGVNLGIGVIVLLYYFIFFHKTKKTSIGAALMFIILIPIYIPFYIKNPISLLFLIPVMVIVTLLHKKIEKKISKMLSRGLMVFFIGLFSPLFIWFTKWSEQFVTENILEGYFFFQLIIWYVLFKTLMTYKKELDSKYKGVFS